MRIWAWWHQGTGPDEYRIRELLRAIWDLHAMFGADEPWLWRGQAKGDYAFEPAIHTRIRSHSTLNDGNVVEYATGLMRAARNASLDVHEGMRLPDMALLALLQHHGAATPLLDVSLDPIVALYMATVSPYIQDEEEDGALFAIRRPSRVISDFDSRRFEEIYTWIAEDVALYSAPDVSERLRIQRGHFLLGRVSEEDARVTIPLAVDTKTPAKGSWIWTRMSGRGNTGPPSPATTDVAVFRVTAKFKKAIRLWLEARSGLTRDFVLPTSWHQPHLDRFASSHGRTAKF
jgi:FRG domain